MRRGFLLATLGLGALALLASILTSPRRGPRPDSAASADRPPALEEPAPAPKEAQLEPQLAGRAELPPTRPPASDAEKEATSQTEDLASAEDDQREAQLAARIAELGNLSTKTDRASLDTLLSEVRNPDQEIRQAALDALCQSGHRAAIPGLREAAAQTADAGEKQAILDAIEYLTLPTLTEIMRGSGATNRARPVPARP